MSLKNISQNRESKICLSQMLGNFGCSTVGLYGCMALDIFFCTSMIEGRKRLFFEGGGREMRKKRKGDLNIILVPLSVTAANLDQVVRNKVFNVSFGWLQPIYSITLSLLGSFWCSKEV